jgi:uncharacterized protein YgiM (DUF1202 family)
MKTNWLLLGTMLATSAVAQVNTNKLPEIPPPAIATPAAPAALTPPAQTVTNAPVKKTVKAKKKIKKAKTAAKAAAKTTEKKGPEAPVTLVPGPATVAADHVNLRGQAGLQGEVVGHVQKGDTVTVLAQINLDKPKAGEPAQWAKIALPADTKVWVNAKFVDVTNSVVTAKKLNLRGGPGENYSVLGVVDKGTPITAVTTKDDWIQVQTPTSAFAFVAASYLKQEGTIMDTNIVPPAVAVTAPVPEAPPVEPTPTTVPEPPPIAPPTPEPATPATPAAPEVAPPPAPATPAMVLPPPTLAPEDTNLPPPPPRVVTHEGYVRHSVSLVAPTDFELYDPANNKAINYLYTTSTNLNLGRYDSLHITVTGEEAMDVRWKDTPVLTIQKIYVLPGDKLKSKKSSAAAK